MNELRRIVENALEEDLGSGDLTTDNLVPAETMARAAVVYRSDGVVCGLQVLAEVFLFLDNECDPERKALLQRHLDECSPCLAEYGIEDHLKALLARKCGGEHAPDGGRALGLSLSRMPLLLLQFSLCCLLLNSLRTGSRRV